MLACGSGHALMTTTGMSMKGRLDGTRMRISPHFYGNNRYEHEIAVTK